MFCILMQQHQAIDPDNYKKKVDEFLERTRGHKS